MIILRIFLLFLLQFLHNHFECWPLLHVSLGAVQEQLQEQLIPVWRHWDMMCIIMTYKFYDFCG